MPRLTRVQKSPPGAAKAGTGGLFKTSDYLITNRASGDESVGSVRGADCLLGRWRSYAKTGGHGGNDHLRTLVGDRSARAADLRFSILRTLPLDAPREDVLAVESVYMHKLGTRAFGLND